MKKRVLVINYHRVDPGSGAEIQPIDRIFSVTRSSFEAQVKILARHKIPVISLDDLVNNRVTNDFSVIITADDGNLSDYQVIYPVLKANRMTATLFWLACKLDLFSQEQVQQLINDGFSIGSHGISHRDLSRFSEAELNHELEFSKKTIEEKTGGPVEFFSVPYGIYSNRTIEQSIKAGYKAVLTTDARLNFPGERLYLIHRWSVKRSISARRFERILTSRTALYALIWKSKAKKAVSRLIGREASDRINTRIYTHRN